MTSETNDLYQTYVFDDDLELEVEQTTGTSIDCAIERALYWNFRYGDASEGPIKVACEKSCEICGVDARQKMLNKHNNIAYVEALLDGTEGDYNLFRVILGVRH